MALTKATITNLDTKSKIECLFNPTEYTIAKSNSWEPKPVVGKNVPRLDFAGGGARTLNLELFFDVFEKAGQDVRTHVNQLWDLTMIDEKEKNPATDRSRPPYCLFQWGGTWYFKAVVTSLSVRYTLFRQDGTPVRATASLSLQEAEDETDLPGTNPTSYAEAGHRRRIVEPHDSLPLIAYQEYGDASKWRAIAEANRLSDPSAIKPGQVLAIPPI
jgi:nucleoid-associated protein YgaU